MKKKRIWKKGDKLTPRLRKCPPTDMTIEILDVRKTTYYIRENNKKTEIEHKYLEDSYISENGSRIYVWELVKGELDVSKENANKDKGSCGKVKGRSKADDSLQEDS